jgi:hypothetical protein
LSSIFGTQSRAWNNLVYGPWPIGIYLAGISSAYNNTIYKFRYVFDYTKDPIWLDFHYSREGKPYQACLIVRYIDENHLQWFTYFNDVRPADFPDGDQGNVMTLTRVNPLTLSRSRP